MFIRRFLPLFMLLVLSLTLMTYQSNRGIFAPLKILSNPLNELNGAIHLFSESVRGYFMKFTIRDRENQELKEEIKRLLMQQQKYREIFFENQRLNELLSLKENEKRYVATARVISRGFDLWSNTITIEKGMNSGIMKDMAVVTPFGLIGKVTAVEGDYSHVLLITDVNFSSAVKSQETRREAVLSGTGTRRCILKYIPEEDAVKEGEVIVTSGFDDVFPKELMIGYVSKVLKKGTSIFQDAEVTPFQDLTKLDEVIVVRR